MTCSYLTATLWLDPKLALPKSHFGLMCRKGEKGEPVPLSPWAKQSLVENLTLPEPYLSFRQAVGSFWILPNR